MNKQESKNKQWALGLIDKKIEKYTKYRDDKTRTEEHRAYWQGFVTSCNDMQDIITELDEPKKVVLPKIADDFIEEGLSMGSDKVDIIGSAVSFSSAMPTAEFSMWFKKHGELLIDALANGYEVEKEPLYYVVFDILHSQKYLVKNVETNQFYLSNNEKVVGNYEQVRFTEQEIKDIDERYWPFAVKVDGE
ncbi:DUF1642 domain-containing protein [Enterococcus faecalis]|uniref:DUF1642 domain-containing protein n=1 Tax=Enterococcus faecalis TaxID=1351 RepID=UPI002DB97213|nr:DUF1642 domain-containing protein [Enterococcus faecalis]MEB7428367.1 DUF1642 domain-containing protein [Enterococcus faecalis]